MPDRDGYIQGVPCWVDTSEPDPEAGVEFYAGLFGWAFEDAVPPGSEGKYFIARLRGREVAAVGSIPESAPPAAMWNTYVWVDDADETASRATEAGGRVLAEPFDVMDAGRMAVLADPEGAAFCAWQAKEHKGARVVNEPGSRRGGREVVLPRRVRLGDARAGGRVPDVGPARLRRLPWARRP
jgi:predicted enzyme related to lactoylglutathione lyase